jgi:TM2 domain-containing membrane protein YozV
LLRNIALLLNFLVPGTGSLILGKVRVGLVQLLVLAVSALALANSFHSFYFVLALIADWIWALVSAGYSPRTGGIDKRKQTG